MNIEDLRSFSGAVLLALGATSGAMAQEPAVTTPDEQAADAATAAANRNAVARQVSDGAAIAAYQQQLAQYRAQEAAYRQQVAEAARQAAAYKALQDQYAASLRPAGRRARTRAPARRRARCACGRGRLP